MEVFGGRSRYFGIGAILVLFVTAGAMAYLRQSAKFVKPETREMPVLSEFKPIYDEVVSHGPTDKQKIALTFDADMTPYMHERLKSGGVKSYYNQAIIDILRKEHVPATIFVTGLWASAYPQVTKELSSDPLFEIGNHSYSHPAFARPCFRLAPIDEAKKNDEFRFSQKTISSVIGYEPRLFRFPGGCYQKSDLALTKKYGLTVVGWNVDSRDAFNWNKNQIIQAVKREARPGAIVVGHLHGSRNAPQTAEALPTVISYLREKGYTFVKVGEFLEELNGQAER